MILPGLFDLESRMRKIDKNGDPLSKISSVVLTGRCFARRLKRLASRNEKIILDQKAMTSS
jgi:hypothetical protein